MDYTRLTNLEVTGDLKAGTIHGVSHAVADVTATEEGAAIPAGVTHVNVTATNANHIVVLPEPVIGQVITLINGATGYELRSSDPATIGINGGKAKNAESAVAANIVVVVRCVSETNWIGQSFTAAGVAIVLQVAAP